MQNLKMKEKSDIVKIQINGKPVTLYFASNPNNEASDFIKKTLINSYLIKAV